MPGKHCYRRAAVMMVVAITVLAAGDAVTAGGGDVRTDVRGARLELPVPPIDDPCPYIERIDVTCNPYAKWLRANVVSDLPRPTWLTLVADDAFYQTVRTNDNGGAPAFWRYPMPGRHEVCIDGCDICATTLCGCETDADCGGCSECVDGECIQRVCLVVNLPNSSTTWAHGETETTVEWSGASGSQVYMEIYKGGVYVDEYHQWTANDGQAGRGSEIPPSWGTGTDFQIKVIDEFGNFGWSETFAIVAG